MLPMQNKGLTTALSLFLLLTAVLVGGAAGYMIFSFVDLPQVRSLEEYQPSVISRVYTDNNRLLAEFYLENRTPVALEEVPENLIKALIATEDSRFYSHR